MKRMGHMDLEDQVAEAMARADAAHRIEGLIDFIRAHPTAALVAVVYESEDDNPDGPSYDVFFDCDHARALGMLTMAATDLAETVLHGGDEDEE